MGEKLKIVQWAEDLGLQGDLQALGVNLGERPTLMAHSNATGEGLISNGELGADLIRLGEGEKFVPHTHPGDHLLIVVGGMGTIAYDGKIYPTKAGEIYLVDGEVPHGVGAITEHVILAVGSPHKLIDSDDRMTPVDYEAVTSEIGEAECLVCCMSVDSANRLHLEGCSHCPCPDC